MKKQSLVISLLLLLLVSGCGKKSEVYNNSAKDGYKTISAVQGVVFEIPSSITNSATAVTQITAASEFEPDVTYSYKDGENNYLLFNLKGVVVAVTNTTDYHIDSFNSKNISNAFLENSMLGMWFEGDGEKLSFTAEKNKFIATVDAQVVITTEFYGDFCGKFGYIKDGDSEYTIFAGVPVESWSDITEDDQKTINYIVRSLRVTQASNTPEISENESEEPTFVPTITIEPTSVPTPTNTPVPEITSTPIPEITNIPSIITPTQEITSAPTVEPEYEEPQVTEQVKPTPTSTSIPTSTPTPITTPVPTTTSAPDVSATDEKEDTQKTETAPEPERESLNMHNQAKHENNGMPAESSIYAMCSVGESSYVDIYLYSTKSIEQHVVTLIQVYQGEQAGDFLKEYCRVNMFDYVPPEDGTSWHVAKIIYENAQEYEIPYINTRIVGMDGGNLIYRGVPYTKITHDIYTEETQAGVYYVFYAVPNGCKEYALEIGCNTEETQGAMNAAYYYVICD